MLVNCKWWCWYLNAHFIILISISCQQKVISRRLNIPWPTKSPDLISLDYWLWGHAFAVVITENSQILNNMMDTVESVLSNIVWGRNYSFLHPILLFFTLRRSVVWSRFTVMNVFQFCHFRFFRNPISTKSCNSCCATSIHTISLVFRP